MPRVIRSGLLLMLLMVAPGWAAPPANSTSSVSSATIEALLAALGDDHYAVREEAAVELIRRGDETIPLARQRLAEATDPEVRYRLRFILDNIAVPAQAALVLKAPPGVGLEPGDLITHINSRRVRRAAAALQLQGESRVASVLRVRTRFGPRDIGPLNADTFPRLVDYVAPRGAEIAQIVRLFADGFAEEAYDRLLLLPDEPPEDELPLGFRAILAHVAGYGDTALRLLQDSPELARAADERQRWAGASNLDLTAPEKAPFRLELALWNRAGFSLYEPATLFSEPDIRVQRVLVPALRMEDAFLRSAELWLLMNQRRQSDNAGGPVNANTAGNMLAVTAWMLYELDLQSECVRLIGPRSEMLRLTPGGPRKWLRVQTDAWLPFLDGSAGAALDVIYDDAVSILQNPEGGFNVVIRNPAVAAQAALFAYQDASEPRIDVLLSLVSRPDHPALPEYLRWMQFGLTSRNEPLIRDHLERCLPMLNGDPAARAAVSLALLEYVRPRPDVSVITALRSRVSQATSLRERRIAETLLATLAVLAGGDGAAAQRLFNEVRNMPPERGDFRPAGSAEGAPPPAGEALLNTPALRILGHTARFLADPPGNSAGLPALRNPLVAVPLGTAGTQWVVLARDRRLLRYDAAAGTFDEVETPSADWFPLPLTWPWLGCDERSGRAWVYDRRRLVEIPADATTPAAVRMNLRPEQIELFEERLAQHFSLWASAVAATRLPAGENGEFQRHEIRAHAEFVSDPVLPELAFIRVLSENPRFAHAALRGGPHLLLDRDSGRGWTSLELAEALGLQAPLTFHARTTWVGPRPVMPVLAADESSAPPERVSLLLLSNQGLIRLSPDAAEAAVARLALPGDEPYPALIPESCPYVRKDNRWIYMARLPAEGGQVYRLRLADNRVESVDLVNEALPPEHTLMTARAALRSRLDERITALGVPGLEALVTDASRLVNEWR